MDIVRLRELLEEVKDDNKDVQKVLDEIVEYYTGDLDDLINRINSFVKDLRSGTVDNYTDEGMELDILEISGLMYSASRELAKLGGESDLAKSKRQEKFNEVVNKLSGTQLEKRSKAENIVYEYQLLEDIYKRAYEQLKLKLEKADGVYSALKKVYSKRVLELDVFRKEIRDRRFSREDEGD